MSQHHHHPAAPAMIPSPRPVLTAARLRARRVEDVAARPELQRELRGLVGRVQGLLAGRAVLEVACGGGWWTRHLAQSAAGVVGLDDDADLLRAAASRLPPGRARFVAADLTAAERVSGACDAGFAGFLASALPAEETAAVLAALHRRLGPGARMVLVDEREAFGGDDLAFRRQLRELAPDAHGVKLEAGAHFWCLAYTL